MIFSFARKLSSDITFGNIKSSCLVRQKKWLWLWFYNLFNSVDSHRLEVVGPDRLCAEWILKNGGTVRFKLQKEFILDYMDLVPETDQLVRDKLVEVYCDGASINDYGFHHFKNCDHLTKITFISCKLIGDNGMALLKKYMQNNLKYLEIQKIYSITDEGISYLAELSNLETLILHNLPSVTDKKKCESLLNEKLLNTKCHLNL